MFENYYTLGARAFYQLDNNHDIHKDIASALSSKDEPKNIDPVSVLAVLMKNYPLGTRTLVQGVSTVPWMAKPSDKGEWAYAAIPQHGNLSMTNDEIAKVFSSKLEKEALKFVAGKNRIGILLSGGMDSRIVAAVLHKLILSGEFGGEVVAISWGDDNSRDTIYSQRIAKQLNWQHVHMPINPETLHQNIVLAAEMGAEFSPVHLHAMQDVSKLKGLDGVLAGSYGDSIGRGEYSGMKIQHLPHILDKHLNTFSLMLQNAEKQARPMLVQEIAKTRKNFANRSESATREVEYQAHYMRRQLNACMSVIDNRIPFYQMFTDPDVFGFIWSLAPQHRNDDIYEALLSVLPGSLLDIPWARTGQRYNSPSHSPVEDNYPKFYNRYGDWLRNDLREVVVNLIKRGTLQQLGIFNPRALDLWCKHWPKDRSHKADRLDEKMAWLASLSLFVERYNVGSQYSYDYTYSDVLSECKARVHTFLYHKARLAKAKK